MDGASGPDREPPRDRAINQQKEASDPAVSAFVAASAGSGKTTVLTDRMLRLMLAGASPGRIQCLTFTKAAAAEMALRLQRRLGKWVTLDDGPLDAELAGIAVTPGPDSRQTARALFAQVLDLPGGMRVGTIHAFCQSLLRRFPLEAEISPHFQLVEEAEAEAEMLTAREDALEGADPAMIAAVAALVRGTDFARVVHALQSQRSRLAPLLALPPMARSSRIWLAAGCRHASDAEVLAEAVDWGEAPGLQDALRRIAQDGTPGARDRALRMLDWLGLPPEARQEAWDTWLSDFFDASSGKPRSYGSFPNPNVHKAHPWIRTAIEAEQARVLSVQDARRALRCAEASAAMLHLVAPALDAYAAQKQRAGLLDYGDLIGRTERLLEDPGAAWVLYKLDGGIDHLLLDEVQDTAPEQWRIAHRLTEEFFAGLGARGDATRTFFAVGDPKQSIYSFQGADPDEFTRSRQRMAERVSVAGQTWRDVELDVSFRSTAPVLALVDSVFRDPVAAAGVNDVGHIRHIADRQGDAGRVELWPLAPPPDAEGPQPWTIPAENQGLVSAPQRLADAVAAAVAAMLAAGERLDSQDRPLEAGDVLVLVRRRGAFATALVRAFKSRGVAVAGLDRLKLTEQVAVQDLLAACESVLLPEDCLSLACVLTSPLGGLTDDSLMQLALGRKGRLWDTLRARAAEREDWEAAWRFLATLAERADYVTPHALLTEALGALGGRARLLARLGPEAAEPIDELLNAALSYTRLHAPSLQGFVHWLRRSGAEVKREAGGAGSVVRVMTVHGAKGLEAPLVILPDTTGLPPPDKHNLAWSAADGVEVPLWAPHAELRCAAWRRGADTATALRMREYNRLLYVALTRAKDRLVVCGWRQRRGEPSEQSWYACVQRGFGALAGAAEQPFAGPWDGVSLVASCPQARLVPPPRDAGAQPVPGLPAWAGTPGRWQALPVPQEPTPLRPLAPSRPDGMEFGPVPPGTSPLAHRVAGEGRSHGFAIGNAAHTLLQHLPAIPAPARAAAAAAWLQRTGLPEPVRTRLAAQLLAVLALPELAPLFGEHGRPEQPLSGLVGRHVVTGVVDRLAVLPDQVLLADFKTGRLAPATPAATPVRYLRQLAAYRAVLQALFPGRPVRCWLVWTDDATAMLVPGTLLDRHAPTPD